MSNNSITAILFYIFSSCYVDAGECRPQDRCYCESLTAYARHCARAGKPISPEWRKATKCDGKYFWYHWLINSCHSLNYLCQREVQTWYETISTPRKKFKLKLPESSFNSVIIFILFNFTADYPFDNWNYNMQCWLLIVLVRFIKIYYILKGPDYPSNFLLP